MSWGKDTLTLLRRLSSEFGSPTGCHHNITTNGEQVIISVWRRDKSQIRLVLDPQDMDRSVEDLLPEIISAVEKAFPPRPEPEQVTFGAY